QAQRHLAPVQARLRRRLCQPLQIVEAAGPAKARLQRPPVDRTRLDRPGPAVQPAVGPAEAGHAADMTSAHRPASVGTRMTLAPGGMAIAGAASSVIGAGELSGAPWPGARPALRRSISRQRATFSRCS